MRSDKDAPFRSVSLKDVAKAINDPYTNWSDGLAHRLYPLLPAEALFKFDKPCLWLSDPTNAFHDRFDARAEHVTLEGCLVTRGALEALKSVIDLMPGSKRDPLLWVTAAGERISLMDYLCIKPYDHHLEVMLQSVRQLGLGAQELQPVVERLLSATAWGPPRDPASLLKNGDPFGSQRYNGTPCVMGLLAAHGAELDAEFWGGGEHDPLFRFMCHPYAMKLQRLQRMEGLDEGRQVFLAAVDALARQGFGRHLLAQHFCPALFAARENDHEALGIFLARGLEPNRPHKQFTPMSMLEAQERYPDPAKKDAHQRCKDLLRGALALDAARRSLDDLGAQPTGRMP